METVVCIAYVLLILLDAIVVNDARCLLLDFLVGQMNRKKAKQLHAQQRFSDRLKMGYIQPLLKKYAAAFRKYHILYLCILYSLLPQYIVVILVYIFLADMFWYVCGVFWGIKLLLALFYRLELGANHMSVYAQKKK